MTIPTSVSPSRVVLVDLDWADADLLPELLRQARVQVRKVAGRSTRDPGMRLAELCGVPRTLELEDLARDSFDVAVVGSASSRRQRIDELVGRAGATLLEPRQWVGDPHGQSRDDIVPPRSGPDLTELTPEALAERVDSAIPDLTPSPGADRDPGTHPTSTGRMWLSARALEARLEDALERHSRAGMPFVAHRLRAEANPGWAESSWNDLVADLRSDDAFGRTGPETMLVLSLGSATAFAPILERFGERWQIASSQHPSERAAWFCERIELTSRADAPLFRAVVQGWLRSG